MDRFFFPVGVPVTWRQLTVGLNDRLPNQTENEEGNIAALAGENVGMYSPINIKDFDITNIFIFSGTNHPLHTSLDCYRH